MSLRTRLIIGYGYLIVLLLVATASGAISFYWVNDSISEMATRYSAQSSEAINAYRALDRQQTRIIEALAEGRRLSEGWLETSDGEITSFLESLSKEQMPADADLSPSQLLASFERYQRRRKTVIAEPIKSTLGDYRTKLQAQQEEIKGGLLDVFQARQKSLRSIGEEGETIAQRAGIWLGFLATFGLISLMLMTRQLQRYLLGPLQEMKTVTDAVSQGATKRRIQIRRNDELGQLAECYNRAVDQRQELEQEMLGRLNQERQLLVGMLELESASHAIFSLSGRLVASSWEIGRTRQKGISDWIRQTGRDKLRGFESGSDERPDAVIEADDVYLKIELLSVHGVRPIGWYVRRLQQ